MTKNKLIALLQNIKGNPEIVLWNGMVGDWMGIDKLTPGELTKQTEEYWIKSVEFEHKRDMNDWNAKLSEQEVAQLKKQYKGHDWNTPDYVTQEDIDQKRYKTKRVVYIEPKKRNVDTFDRFGSISY